MELKLNETPVRTSRNFNINNIKIKDIEINGTTKVFKSTQIIGASGVRATVSDLNLTYGVGKDLEDEVRKNANQKLQIEIQNGEDIKIINNFDKDNTNLIDNIEIIVKEGIKANLLIKYKSREDNAYYHNGVIRLKAKKNSNINITIANLLNTNSDNFISLENLLEESASVNYNIVDFGGKHSITNYYSNLSRRFCKE